MTPASYIIKVFGGIRATARALNRAPSTVMAWKTSKKNNGTGGTIPGGNHKLILRIAKKRNLDITPEDLILGRK